ncbi:MAG: hypothetical protein M4D80_41205 [Myxococcota bacterium]|nr:hypothetical protein [Myxococcota bacterium]
MTGFVWHDLMTTDLAHARTVAGELFGWNIREDVVIANNEPIAMLVPFDAPGFGSHWVPYVDVADVDAFCDKTRAAGGTVCVPPSAHPNGGRFAFLMDTQRGFFSARSGFTPPAQTGFRDVLLADDVAAAHRFYQTLLGWTLDDSAIIQRPPIAPMSLWLPHVIVENVSIASDRATRLGATVLVPKCHVPERGTYAVFADRALGVFAAVER